MPKYPTARITISIDIPLDPDMYVPGASIQEMLAVERSSAERNPTEYFTFFDDYLANVSAKILQEEGDV